MERRQFIQMGMLAGLSSATGVGCASRGVGDAGSAHLAGAPDMDAFLAQLDHSMASIARGAPLQAFLGQGPAAGGAAVPHAADALIKKSLRSLLMAGSFHDLPEEARRHPGMQARLAGSMPEMDEAVFGMTHVLSSFTPAERIRIQEVLHEQPELGARLTASLDADAVSAGISAARRLSLHALGAHVTQRLKQEPLSALIDEPVAEVQRVSARHGYTEEMQRQIVARVVHASLLGMQAGPPAGALAPPPPAPVATGSAAPPLPAGAQPAPGFSPPPYPYPYPPPWAPRAPQEPRKKPDPGMTALTVGGITMGVGITSGGIGLGLLSSFTTTGVGAVLLGIGFGLLLVGLVTLLIGIAIRAAGE